MENVEFENRHNVSRLYNFQIVYHTNWLQNLLFIFETKNKSIIRQILESIIGLENPYPYVQIMNIQSYCLWNKKPDKSVSFFYFISNFMLLSMLEQKSKYLHGGFEIGGTKNGKFFVFLVSIMQQIGMNVDFFVLPTNVLTFYIFMPP